MSPKHYTLTFTSALVGLAVFTILINYLVDPYQIFGSAQIRGFNDFKVDINEHVRTSKAFHPYLGKWDALLVGNSRIEMGLDPAHPCFQQAGLKVYNLGIPGAGVRQQLEYALNVIYQQPVKRVYLSVDFVDFLVRADNTNSVNSVDLASPPINKSLRYAFDGSLNPEYAWAALTDRYRALFSLDALLSSIRTLTSQSPQQPDRDDNGFNPARDFKSAVNAEGAHALFKQKMTILEEKYSQRWRLGSNGDGRSQALRLLKEFLRITDARGIKVTIFTNPFHEKFWELMQKQDMVKMQQEWLKQLVQLVKESGIPDVKLWNFSDDPEYIHEVVPGPGEKSGPLNWFWEPAHFRKELGDLMIDSMLADECKAPHKFGRQIIVNSNSH